MNKVYFTSFKFSNKHISSKYNLKIEDLRIN